MANEYEEVEAAVQARQAQIRAHRLGVVAEAREELAKAEPAPANHWSSWDAKSDDTQVADETQLAQLDREEESIKDLEERAVTASAAEEQVTAITNSSVKAETVSERKAEVPEVKEEKEEPKKPATKKAAPKAQAKDAEGS